MRTAFRLALCLSLASLSGCSSNSVPPSDKAAQSASGGMTVLGTAASGGADGGALPLPAASENGGAIGAGDMGGAGPSSTSTGGTLATLGGAGGAPAAGSGGMRGDAAGAAGSSGATSSVSDPFAANVTPTKVGALWALNFGATVFQVDAATGASVTTFALSGHNVLADGSHFRPSPQKTWNWPPPPEIAANPYTAAINGSVIEMVSQTNLQWGLKAKKRFWANSASGVVSTEYTLTNTSDQRASWGPWEVSRVNATGLTFFPEGNPIPAKPASFGQVLSLQLSLGASWLDYKAAQYTTGNYIVAHDGLQGWAAHAESGVVFIKSFPDILPTQIPPEEGEVQLWTDSTHTALEMENEGAYTALEAGSSIVWTMRWYLRAIPSDVPVSVGSSKLLDFVHTQLLQ
jgi:hypothetical protein